ncbi:T9SS type A sorting domain-containing protein [Owenweeksia hongkongensis]|uniref:T9SS type A sorting domain-containing protein n=1 Tax=Owenweeksia hongkongensis TaxID=253245 RepID=UPI003A8E3595
MNKKLFSFLLAGFATIASLKAQFTFDDLEYFVGSGSDTAMLIVDFKDGSAYATDSSYAWGYLFNGTTTGEDMLTDIAAADINLTVNASGGFLNDVIYGSHEGLGGQPDYWSTWSGTDSVSLAMNSGIGTSVAHGDWFAISYGFTPSAVKPGFPIAAWDPNTFTATDVKTWVGTGSDSAILVVDFLSGNTPSSFAWGVLFTDSTTGSDMLNEIANADTNFTVNATSFLNDIIYKTDSGMGGLPNYWGTWSATNYGNWAMNAGIGTKVENGDLFGASYTDFAPALRPGAPFAVDNTVGLAERKVLAFSIYPNPASDYIQISADASKPLAVKVYQGNGNLVISQQAQANERILLAGLPVGIYLVQVNGETQPVILR